MENNKKIKYLHLFPVEKFTNDYIRFINNNFNPEEHLFLTFGERTDIEINKDENVKKITISKKSLKDVIYLIKRMYSSEKIFLHSLFNKNIVKILFVNSWLLKKCNWIIWGGDLYSYKFKKRNTWRAVLYEKIRAYVIKNMSKVSCAVKGDCKLAKKWYGFKGKYYECLIYPSNVFKNCDLAKVKENNKNTIYIQIGNSASSTNNHLEVFKKLEKYKENDIEIISPLSYGDPEYREKVIIEGKRMFGNKFNPLVEFLPFSEYLKILSKVDVAIFNHRRQQAMGNIITLLGFGKKVYIRNDITSWKFFKEKNINVYNARGNFNDIFESMSAEIKENNMKNIMDSFSEKELKNQWSKIFI
jgi:hypothetical protein